MADPEEPQRVMREFPLREFLEEGILFKVNNDILWPLGLALTVVVDHRDGSVSKMHVTEWNPPEVIGLADDEVEEQRRAAFAIWEAERMRTLIP
jgi:hypothetical protein